LRKIRFRASREARRNLTRLGFDPRPIDGTGGKGTRAAIGADQKSRGLALTGGLTPDLAGKLARDSR
jgi:peptidoglycan hydrolase-like protein with peptidoglycan-binding domain